jgi:hypothetical protein
MMSNIDAGPEAAFTVLKGGARIVSFCCDVSLYTGADLSSIPEQVLYIYDRFLALCPPERLRWYATEHMSKHKPVTPRVLDMPRGWLKPGAPPQKTISIDLKDGVGADEAPEYSFWVYGSEPGDLRYGRDANSIRCTFPGPWAVTTPEALLTFATDACAHFPYIWGHAGLVLETSPYYRGDSHTAAWRLSMQHPGLDISNPVTDASMVRRDGIKGVNWLTMLGPEYADRIGGFDAIRQKLPESVEIIPAGHGVILRAGPAPRWGRVNEQDLLPEYRAVYKVVAPLQDPVVQRYTSFSLPGGDHKAKTTAWLRRFGDGS